MSDSAGKSGLGCGTLAGWGTFLAGLAAVIGIVVNLNDAPPKSALVDNPSSSPEVPSSSAEPATPESQPSPEPVAPAEPANLLGTWSFPPYGYSVVSNQVGNTFNIQSFNHLNVPISAGTGRVEAQQIFIDYVSFDGSPGQVVLKLSKDGRQMSGTWGDLWGRSGYVTLTRQ